MGSCDSVKVDGVSSGSTARASCPRPAQNLDPAWIAAPLNAEGLKEKENGFTSTNVSKFLLRLDHFGKEWLGLGGLSHAPLC